MLHPHFMTVDFGLVRGEEGELEPKLVEMQAFPSIFGLPAVAGEGVQGTCSIGEGRDAELKHLPGWA